MRAGVVRRVINGELHLQMRAKLTALNGQIYILMIGVGVASGGTVCYPGQIEHDDKYFECVNGENEVLEYKEPE